MFSLCCLVIIYVQLACAETRLGGKIVGGVPTDIKDVPYQISLTSKRGRHFCGASIISKSWAVSAAHCTTNPDPSRYTIRAGTSFVKGGTSHNIKNIVNHPKYNEVSPDYDINLIEVIEPFQLGKPGVQAVKLATIVPEDGSLAIISGWGSTNPWSNVQLRKAQVPIVNIKKCRDQYAEVETITDRMICAGYEQGGVDSCQGDSGGPMVVDGELVGIVSFGMGCARPDFPGVYTRVDAVRDWIKTVSNV